MSKRTLTFLLLSATTVCAYAFVADNLFPTKSGATWQFTGKAGPSDFSPTCKIVSTKKSGNKTVVLMKWSAKGTALQDETYWVTANSVERVSSGVGGSNKISPPIPVIRYPMTVGKSWKWTGTVTTQGNRIPGNATIKVAKRERINTKAGPFDTYRVDMELVMSAGGQTVRLPNSYWFSPGKGMVKQSANLMGSVIEATVTKISGL
jgi:hypothetical protein